MFERGITMRMLKKRLRVLGVIGFVGAALMFVGDMLFYYSPEPIQDPYHDMLRIMGGMSKARLITGGVVGPIAAFMYYFGFYHVGSMIKSEYKVSSYIVFGLFSLSMTFGSAYHAFFTPLGLMAGVSLTKGIELMETLMPYFFIGVMIPSVLGSVLLIYRILKGQTYYPKWMIVFTPVVLLFVGELFKTLPQPFYIIVSGGWFNIMYMLFFGMSLMMLEKYDGHEENI